MTLKVHLACAAVGLAVFSAAGVVDVDRGRQLFVDDFVIAVTNGVVRHWNVPVKVEAPVLRPTAPDGARVGGCTVAADGGLWWDPTIGRFRLWYEDDWCGHMRYAESRDGISWEKPDLGVVKGTNRVFADDMIDTWSVSPDYAASDPYRAWKLFISAPGDFTPDTLFTSVDGRRFARLGVIGKSGDRSTAYYDPFRGNWVFSLRDYWASRTRDRFEARDFLPPEKSYAYDCTVAALAPPHWTELPRGVLYSFTAVPYESLMLGVEQILSSTPKNALGHVDNDACHDAGLPKQTHLRFAFSRDGRAFAPGGEACAIRPCGWGSGKWDTGYLSAIGGVCVIRDERLWFYYSAFRGDATRNAAAGYGTTTVKGTQAAGLYYNGAIGAATLRRDGFAGMVADGRGEIETKPLSFTGGHLFVNAECLYGRVEAAVVGTDGKPLPGFDYADCKPLVYVDRTKAELVFRGGSLASLGKAGVRIRFRLHCATLYSFWLTPDPKGASRGYVAAGGPAYRGLRDDPENADDPFEIAWRRLFEKFYEPKTGLVFENLPDETPGAIARNLPTPAEIAKAYPIPTGWNTGMEDGVLNGCPLLLAALLRNDAEAVGKLLPGILRCATVSGVPGFLARSYSPADGKSFYPDSSRDQYTLFVYTMWRVARSPLCPPARREEIGKILVDIARRTESCMDAAHAFTLVRVDGKPGLVSQMWMENPKGKLFVAPEGHFFPGHAHLGGIWSHEANRLPMIYAAAHALSGDARWRTRELEVADDALRIAEGGVTKVLKGFALFQMQVSLRLLWECETDAARKERYRAMLRRVAGHGTLCIDRAEKLFAELKGDLSAPAGDWRTWPKKEMPPSGGLPCALPTRPAGYQKAYECVRETGEGVIVPLLAPDFALAPAEIARFRALVEKSGYARCMSPGIVYPVLADAMLRCGNAGTNAGTGPCANAETGP